MNLIEQGSLVVIEMAVEAPSIMGVFTTLTATWAGLHNAVNAYGKVVGPTIVPLSATALIRPANTDEQANYKQAFI